MKSINLISNLVLFVCVVLLAGALMKQKTETLAWKTLAIRATTQTEQAVTLTESCIAVAHTLQGK